MKKWYRFLILVVVLALAGLGPVNGSYYQYGSCHMYCDGQEYVTGATYSSCCFTPRYWAEGCVSTGYYWNSGAGGEGPQLCGG